jgi:hypothetical protein
LSDVPAGHLDLLTAVSPPLRNQVSSRCGNSPAAGDYGIFNEATVERVEHMAVLVLHGLTSVLLLRERLVMGASPAAAVADVFRVYGRSISISSVAGNPTAAAGMTVVPREQRLLLPLVLTLVEYMLLLPAPIQSVVPPAMRLVVLLLSQSGEGKMHVPTASRMNAAAAAADTALADPLVAPVLLQLGPAVLQYLREAAAPAAGPSALERAIRNTSMSNTPDPQELPKLADNLALLVEMLLNTGKETG